MEKHDMGTEIHTSGPAFLVEGTLQPANAGRETQSTGPAILPAKPAVYHCSSPSQVHFLPVLPGGGICFLTCSQRTDAGSSQAECCVYCTLVQISWIYALIAWNQNVNLC